VQAKAVIDLIKSSVLEVKKNKQEVISVDALVNYLDSLKTDLEGSEEANKLKFESDLAVFRAEHERNLAHYEAQQLFSLEMLRSVITYGQAALKSALLINGGAAAALLAFIGNIWAKNTPQAAVDSLTNSIIYFAFGVLSAAFGTGTTYLTQYCYSVKWQRPAIWLHIATILIVLIAYGLFGKGSYDAYLAFVEQLSPNNMLQPTQ